MISFLPGYRVVAVRFKTTLCSLVWSKQYEIDPEVEKKLTSGNLYLLLCMIVSHKTVEKILI